MNDKGMIITSLLYAILVLFILILFSIVLTVGIRKSLVDNVASKIEAELDFIPPIIIEKDPLQVFTGQTIDPVAYKLGLTATDDIDGDITSNIVCLMPSTAIECTVTDQSGNTSAVFTRKVQSGLTQLIYNYNGTYRTFISPVRSKYKVQMWGAQGGSNMLKLGGGGTYVTAELYLDAGQIVYIYVGGSPKGKEGGYNGGGNGGSQYDARGGGGGTDLRLIPGAWNTPESLRSRIFVTPGGGGADGYLTGTTGGPGGLFDGFPGLFTGTGTYTNAGGGSQIAGGAGAIGTETGNSGTFGIGGSAFGNRGSGGGGGYYGGGAGSFAASGSGTGGGGSSFLPGYNGFNGVDEQGNPTGLPFHYTGFSLSGGAGVGAGNVTVPNKNNVGGQRTNSGNQYSGFAKIEWLSL